MHEVVTTVLDVLGLLLLAAGVAATVASLLGAGPGLIVAAVVVLVGSWRADRSAPRRRRAGGDTR
ncbi:hypothetical protein [Micromonospora pallida]|uniref:hypothetical protein n=1 Tax=Micromonospora pallida TaxID=145854 RepID=UPI001FE019E0|nr:hypothetical protein [Micromonospora pallida]